MTTVDISSYKKLYLETAKEYCNMLSSNYDKLSLSGFDKDALNNMYISAHSLKSQSQAMGYIKMETLSGMIEKAIKDVIDNNKRLSGELLNILKETINNIQQSLKSIEAENKERDTDTVAQKLEDIH